MKYEISKWTVEAIISALLELPSDPKNFTIVSVIYFCLMLDAFDGSSRFRPTYGVILTKRIVRAYFTRFFVFQGQTQTICSIYLFITRRQGKDFRRRILLIIPSRLSAPLVGRELSGLLRSPECRNLSYSGSYMPKHDDTLSSPHAFLIS